MIERFAQFPAALASRARTVRLGPGIPALLAHPDWTTPAPTVLWMHGRTAYKELDPGRYLRWIRAGIAACAVDLPGHGERLDTDLQQSARTPDLLAQMVGEIDQIVEALADPQWKGVFDLDRLGIGGMSAGGMATLRRLCDPHPFRCAAVEGTTGDLARLYGGDAAHPWLTAHDAERIRPVDPAQHLETWRPIPLLAVHSQADEVIPFSGMEGFIERLRARYREAGADPGLIELVSWPSTGAPQEHLGFGRYSNEAKNTQTAFLARHLGASPAGF